MEKILNLPSSRISSFTNLPQNSGKFGFRDIPKYRVFIWLWCWTCFHNEPSWLENLPRGWYPHTRSFFQLSMFCFLLLKSIYRPCDKTEASKRKRGKLLMYIVCNACLPTTVYIYSFKQRPQLSAVSESKNINKRRPRISAAFIHAYAALNRSTIRLSWTTKKTSTVQLKLNQLGKFIFLYCNVFSVRSEYIYPNILLNGFGHNMDRYFTNFERSFPSPKEARKKCEKRLKCTPVLSPKPFKMIFIMWLYSVETYAILVS